MMIIAMPNPALRFLTILPVACAMTLGILFMMHLLVHKDFGEIVEQPEPPRIMPFTAEAPPLIEVRLKPAKPEKPEKPTLPPTLSEVQVFDPVTDADGPGLTFTEIAITPPTISIQTDNQLMPFIKVQPGYPATAAARSIEGYVDVVFDVTAAGATENIRIANAVPSSIFNRSVVQAVKRWKYKPKLIEGAPTKSFDVHERITFELEKG